MRKDPPEKSGLSTEGHFRSLHSKESPDSAADGVFALVIQAASVQTNPPTRQAGSNNICWLQEPARGLAAATSDTSEVWQDAKGDSPEGSGSLRRGSVSEGLSLTAAQPGELRRQRWQPRGAGSGSNAREAAREGVNHILLPPGSHQHRDLRALGTRAARSSSSLQVALPSTCWQGN